jgi:AraC-like DNA-binding protein/ligand-binding sensor protein
MVSAPGLDFLPIGEQSLFVHEFQKDVEFLQLLILMISRSCATGSVDITWVDSHEGLRQVIGTVDAAKGPCSRYLQWTRQDPSQRFCNIVSDYGRRAAESCAVCENAAEKRAGESGRAQVYRCHAGLTDIAVPVIADGRHIATLYSGQVLTETPTKAGFDRVARDVQALSYIELPQLERAYQQVPVVSEEDIENTVRILEVFAEFLGRFWKRLGETVKLERQKVRSSQLAAKEFAYMVLQPANGDRARVAQLMKELRFVQPPNRVLITELQGEDEFDTPSVSFDLLFTTAIQAVEELAERSKNMTVAYLRRRGVCVFFRDLTEGPSAGLRARSLAEKILYEISSRCHIRARVGIGGLKTDWRQLAESYHEASLALAKSDEVIAVCGDATAGLSELTAQTEIVCQHLANQRIQDARLALRSLPMMANRRLGNSAIADHRNFFSSALESLCFTALKTGCDAEATAVIRTDTQSELQRAATVFDVQSVFLEAAEAIAAEIKRLLSSKHEKVISRVQQMLDRRMGKCRPGDTLSLGEAARALGVSTGHLSRMFRQVTGLTFRDYVISRRIEHARLLLLDPLNNVSVVAERCGFSTPSYFARVFRKVVGCAPTAYASDPRSFAGGERAVQMHAE